MSYDYKYLSEEERAKMVAKRMQRLESIHLSLTLRRDAPEPGADETESLGGHIAQVESSLQKLHQHNPTRRAK